VDNLTGDITVASSLYVRTAPTAGETNAAIYVASGDVIIGSGTTAAANSYSKLVIAEDDYSRIELINPADKVGTIWFSDATEGMGRIDYAHPNDEMQIRTNGTQALRITSDHAVYINDGTDNTNMTVGLTINQEANDDAILAFKSSDVAHGMTSVGGPSETDDYFILRKNSGGYGGIDMRAYADDAALNTVLNFQAYGGTATTTKSTAGIGLINMQAYEHDGSNGLANITADGNVFSIRARVGGSLVTRMLVDEDGDLYSVTSAQTFDDYDDMALIETYDAARSGSLKEQIKADFGRTMLMDEATLIEAGVLGDTMANGGMTNQTQLSRVLTGGVRQLNQKHLSLAEKVEGLEVELIEAKKQLAAISA